MTDSPGLLQKALRADYAMLGPPKESRRDELFLNSLELWLSADNVYRQLDAKLNLSLVRAWVA